MAQSTNGPVNQSEGDGRLTIYLNTHRSLTVKLTSAQHVIETRFAASSGKCACVNKNPVSMTLPTSDTEPLVRLNRNKRRSTSAAWDLGFGIRVSKNERRFQWSLCESQIPDPEARSCRDLRIPNPAIRSAQVYRSCQMKLWSTAVSTAAAVAMSAPRPSTRLKNASAASCAATPIRPTRLNLRKWRSIEFGNWESGVGSLAFPIRDFLFPIPQFSPPDKVASHVSAR